MKNIAILTCLRSVGSCCTGAGCIGAFYDRTGGFAQYGDEELQLCAQFHCNGCGHPLEGDPGMEEKIQYILKVHPDAIHLGVCTHDRAGGFCPTIRALADIFMDSGIPVIDGTHDSGRIQKIGAPLTRK